MKVNGARANYDVRGLPQVAAGPMANADDFGASNARELSRFGSAVQGLGHEVIRQDQIRRQKHDDAFVRDRINDMHTQWTEASKDIFSKQGADAGNAPELAQQFFDNYRTSNQNQLENKRQQEAFGKAWQAFRTQSVNEAIGHRDEQDLIFQQETLDGQNAGISQEARDNFAAANTPDGRAVNAGRLQQIMANVDQRYSGHPPEVISLKRREAATTFHNGILTAMEPKDALEYLEQDGVKAAFGAAAVKQLQEKFKQAKQSNDVAQAAIADVESNQYDSAALMRRAYELYPDDTQAADMYLKLADSYSTRKRNTENAKGVEQTANAWSAFAESNYDIRSLPNEIRSNNPKLFREMIDYAEWYNKAGGGDKLDPDLLFQDGLLRMQPAELTAWLNQPGNYDHMMRKMAGNQGEIRRVLEWARKEDAGGGSGGTGGAGGGGGAGQSTKFNASDWFQNNYGAMYSKSFLGFTTGPRPYDRKNEEDASRENGFRLRFNRAVAEKESETGKKTTYQEQEEIAFDLVREVRAGRVNLDSNIYNASTAAQTIQELPAKVEELTPEQMPFHRGESIVTRQEPGGQPQRFGKLDPYQTDIAVGGVIDPVYQARNMITDIVTAYDSGVKTVGEESIAYEPGWKLVTMKDGAVEVYDETWRYRDTVHSVKASGQAGGGNGVAPVAETTIPAPPILGMLRKDLEEYAKKHPDTPVDPEWTGSRYILRTPGALKVYDGGGFLLDSQLVERFESFDVSNGESLDEQNELEERWDLEAQKLGFKDMAAFMESRRKR